MKFGYFDDANKEYVITSPRTPYPWINYLGNQGFFSLISNTAGGYSFYKDARLRRITRYRYNNVPIDMGGRYFYINDNGTIWNPGWSPVKTELDAYECRHGMGYTIITGKKNDLKAEVTFFVPQNYDGEVQQVVLTNEGSSEKSFSLFSFEEWCLWDAQDDCTNFQRNFSTGRVEVVGSTIYHKTEYRDRRNHFAFYTVNDTIDGYDTDRDSFIGLYNGFHEPQGFAIMSDIDEEATKKTLKAVDDRLNTKHGLVLNNPAYTKYYVQYGEISTYPGGYKENAGIFTHNNAWIICAAAYAGEGDQAFKYYSEIAPAFTEETSDIHKTEPYVYGQMIGGKDAGSDIGQTGKNFGQGKNSWLTGTAAWNMVAISQYILGVQPDFDGLKIDPSIPAEWDGLTISRKFRGATYDIKVTNPDHVCKGIKSVTVDGNAIEGNVLPVFEDGNTHSVEVVMG